MSDPGVPTRRSGGGGGGDGIARYSDRAGERAVTGHADRSPAAG